MPRLPRYDYTPPAGLAADLIATDSEWDTHAKDPWISTAFASAAGTLVCCRADVPLVTRERLSAAAQRYGVRLCFGRRDDTTSLLAFVLKQWGMEDVGKVRLLFYYSPRDVEYALSWQDLHHAIHSGKVRQHNHLSGRVGPALLRDVAGWAGKEPLYRLANSLGVAMPAKTSMDDYKTNMLRGLNERPDSFLRYAIGDVRVLLDVYQCFVTFVRQIQQDVLQMKDAVLFNHDNTPMTSGRLVALLFERWLYEQAGPYADALRFCMRKLGYLDPDDDNYRKNRDQCREVLSRCRTLEAFTTLATEEPKTLRQFCRARYLFTALEGGGVRWWASRATTETAIFNGPVHGGRCHNENPFAYATGPGLDVDIAGCYGTSQRHLTYPIGLPKVWSFRPNAPRPTLGEWLAANEAELVSGLWTAVISGRLPFEQDLLHSKILKVSDLRKPAITEGSKIPSEIALLRREVKNAVLTADLLDALKKVATNTEWAALSKLEIVTAAAYRKKDRVADVEEWCRVVLAEPDADHKLRVKPREPSDKRTRKWYGIPLESFIGRLMDVRADFKRKGREATTDEERAQWSGMDTIVKLLVNTLYGDLVSQHFPIGNTIVANNITARGRLGVWMVAKALGLRQSITDGGIYTPSAVPHYKRKRPGLDTLSRLWNWRSREYQRTLEPLPGLHWESGMPLGDEADGAALAHVRAFWEPYRLPFLFTLSHKRDNSFLRSAYWSKADYALQVSGKEKPLYKIRGKNRNKITDEKPHPTYAIMDAILNDSDTFPEDLTYCKGGIMKVASYLQAQSSEGGYADRKTLRPGDNLPVKEYTANYNNTHFPLADEADYRCRRDRRKVHRGKPVRWFERYGSEGIAKVHQKMAENHLGPVPKGEPVQA
jgi:hypothetical protein